MCVCVCVLRVRVFLSPFVLWLSRRALSSNLTTVAAGHITHGHLQTSPRSPPSLFNPPLGSSGCPVKGYSTFQEKPNIFVFPH
uniref:Secreted protein n=1 Tax=Anguilla anguilla TaxID=7936 RepID=A0A0E9RFD0_ANGAN